MNSCVKQLGVQYICGKNLWEVDNVYILKILNPNFWNFI